MAPHSAVAKAAADKAWAECGRQSKVVGVGESLRAESAAGKIRHNPRPAEPLLTTEQRLTVRKTEMRSRAAKRRARRTVKPVDDGRYFPHQNEREMARRMRQGLVGQGYSKAVPEARFAEAAE